MGPRELYRETTVTTSQNECFEFFSDPHNLLQLTPDSFKMEITNDEPIEISEGSVINMKIRLFGVIPVSWTSIIENFDPPHGFADRQLSGPYSSWQHIHKLVAKNGNTVIIDKVYYKAPGWILEPLINLLFVRRSLINLFDYRQKMYRKLLGEPKNPI